MLYKLHVLGFLATLAPRNAPTVDILVMNPNESVVALLQVKARTRGRDKGWHMSKKHESFCRLFCAFVDLEPNDPVTYIVPARAVADVLHRSHSAWLAAPGLRGRAHQDTEMRRVLPKYPFPVEEFTDGWMAPYLERWDSLRGKPAKAPSLR